MLNLKSLDKDILLKRIEISNIKSEKYKQTIKYYINKSFDGIKKQQELCLNSAFPLNITDMKDMLLEISDDIDYAKFSCVNLMREKENLEEYTEKIKSLE